MVRIEVNNLNPNCQALSFKHQCLRKKGKKGLGKTVWVGVAHTQTQTKSCLNPWALGRKGLELKGKDKHLPCKHLPCDLRKSIQRTTKLLMHYIVTHTQKNLAYIVPKGTNVVCACKHTKITSTMH